MELGIVIPAYNEEESVGSVVEKLREFGRVIVVDDASSDGTAAVAAKSGAIVVIHPENRGYDGALNSGMEKAFSLGCSHVVTMDADGQHPTPVLRLFLEKFAEGFPLVVGVRHRHQRFSERAFALYSSLRFGIHDPMCGMKGYSAELYHRQGYFDSYESIGTELAFRSVRAGARFAEISFETPERAHGKPRFATRLKANCKILRALALSVIKR